MIGLTLGYSIFIVRRYMGPRLPSHECRHVYQYETSGSVAEFLPSYLQQIATVCYLNAPLEQDARAHEIEIA
jgi:transposase-like protein